MLGFHISSFDPQTLVVLETAFDEAWLTLKSIGNTTVKPDELARYVLRLAMEGERDPLQKGLRKIEIERELHSNARPVPSLKAEGVDRLVLDQSRTVRAEPRSSHSDAPLWPRLDERLSVWSGGVRGFKNLILKGI